uniref:Cytochrome c oxidase subunit 2 n=1 Tax=Aglaiogyrodactylus calamus TaxID=1972627 RepID=A0A7L8XUS2_9PLAT|nr:cytochrome c oxidase subunit II [Aglaiogyrodactylus calamus]
MQNVFVYYNMVVYVSLLCVFLCVFVILLIWLNSNIKNIWALPIEHHSVELLWTIVPVILVSFLCVLNLDNINKESLTGINNVIKVAGQQWRWSYEALGGHEYTSEYMMDRGVATVDKPLYIPYSSITHFLLSSADVIHAFSVPDLGLKLDCIPGRVNNIVNYIDRIGIFSGYCSELCGVGHSFMPNHY